MHLKRIIKGPTFQLSFAVSPSCSKWWLLLRVVGILWRAPNACACIRPHVQHRPIEQGGRTGGDGTRGIRFRFGFRSKIENKAFSDFSEILSICREKQDTRLFSKMERMERKKGVENITESIHFLTRV